MVAKHLFCLSICLAALESPCLASPNSGDIAQAPAIEQSGPPLLRQTKRLNAGASVEDIVSNTGSSMFFNSGERTVRGFILGNELHIMRSQGSSPTSAEDTRLWKTWCANVSAKVWAIFGKQTENIGQANLTLVVNADGSWDVLSKTIYVPDSEPFSGGQPLSKAAADFWLQVHSALSIIDEIAPPTTPDVESVKFELVMGRDEESFPRHRACGQLNLMRRSPSGKGVTIGRVESTGMKVQESSN